MKENIIIFTTLIIILCRIRYAMKRVKSYDEMDIRLSNMFEMQQWLDQCNECITISTDISEDISDDEGSDLMILED